MPKSRKTYPWVVYHQQGIFANTIDRFPTQEGAQHLVQELRKHCPGQRINFYFERRNPAPITRQINAENN